MAQSNSADSQESWSWTVESGTRGHRLAPTAEARSRFLRSLAPVLLGMLVGTLIGFVVGAASPPQPLAETRIEVALDPVLPSDSQSTTDEDRFIQGEVLVLDGDDLANRVRQKMQLGKPLTVSATQLGTTNVIDVKVGANSGPEAVAAAGAVIDGYREIRRQALDQRVDQALAVVKRQLTSISASARDSRSDPEYARLLSLRNQLQLMRDSDQEQVTIMLQPRAVRQQWWVKASRFALMGFILGALLGLLAKLVMDRYNADAVAVAKSPT